MLAQRCDAGGWQSATIDTQWQIDDQPPTLTVDGSAARSTSETTVTISGLVSDQQSALQGVSIVSDRYPGLSFGAVIGNMGNFSAEVPLKPDANQLTVSAADIHGNTASVHISVTQELTALPVITITSPADGDIVTAQPINVAGTVRSSLTPDHIRLQLGDQEIFPEGSANPYTFTFNQVSLSPGSNLLAITAQTPHGTTSATVGVTYSTQTGQGEPEKPQIEVYAPLPDTFLTENPVVTGLITGQSAIESVTVNGQTALCTGLGSTYVSFQAAPTVSEGQQSLTISISATDNNNQTATLSYTVSIDTSAPVIHLDTSPQAPPNVNPVNDSAYTISGTVSDSHMAGLSVNDQSVALTPEGDNLYRFSARLALSYGQEQTITLMAWDQAGNRTGTEWIVSLSSDLTIEVISPRNGAQLQVQGETADVAVTVRVSGAAVTDVFTVALDDNPAQSLIRAGSVGNATLAVPTDPVAHQLTFSVQNDTGSELARTTTSFSLENMDDVPLAVEDQRPANGADGIEPNEFVTVYFNKAIDPGLLDIQVLETVHGKTYNTAGNGADITKLSDVNLIEVHRDREPVPGGLSHFPGNLMAAFYPQRDLAYGATVYVNVIYDGAELSRTSYKIRVLPSLIEGFVTDSAANPISGVKVHIPDLDLTAETNSDGAYCFGFGMDAGHALAAGRYKLVVNPDMQNTAYGTLTYWIRVRQGQLNSIPVVKLPVISAQIPFRRIISGKAENILAGGALKLDLSEAQLTFSDLRHQGDVHVQFLSVEKLPYAPLPYATPLWVFCTQPAGVKVSGQVGLSLAVPTRSGGYTYLEDFGSLVVLVGLDPDALMIVPVGVGQMDMDSKTVTSRGQVHLQRLDFIGYVHMKADAQPLLEQYVNNEISLRQMIAGLEDL